MGLESDGRRKTKKGIDGSKNQFPNRLLRVTKLLKTVQIRWVGMIMATEREIKEIIKEGFRVSHIRDKSVFFRSDRFRVDRINPSLGSMKITNDRSNSKWIKPHPKPSRLPPMEAEKIKWAYESTGLDQKWQTKTLAQFNGDCDLGEQSYGDVFVRIYLFKDWVKNRNVLLRDSKATMFWVKNGGNQMMIGEAGWCNRGDGPDLDKVWRRHVKKGNSGVVNNFDVDTEISQWLYWSNMQYREVIGKWSKWLVGNNNVDSSIGGCVECEKKINILCKLDITEEKERRRRRSRGITRLLDNIKMEERRKLNRQEKQVDKMSFIPKHRWLGVLNIGNIKFREFYDTSQHLYAAIDLGMTISTHRGSQLAIDLMNKMTITMLFSGGFKRIRLVDNKDKFNEISRRQSRDNNDWSFKKTSPRSTARAYYIAFPITELGKYSNDKGLIIYGQQTQLAPITKSKKQCPGAKKGYTLPKLLEVRKTDKKLYIYINKKKVRYSDYYLYGRLSFSLLNPYFRISLWPFSCLTCFAGKNYSQYAVAINILLGEISEDTHKEVGKLTESWEKEELTIEIDKVYRGGDEHDMNFQYDDAEEEMSQNSKKGGGYSSKAANYI